MARCCSCTAENLFIEDTNSVDLTLAVSNLKADLRVNPSAANPLSVSAAGLYCSGGQLTQVFYRDEAAVTVGSGMAVLMLPYAIEVLGVSAAVATAPTGSSIIVDVNAAGVTLFTNQANRPKILAGATDSVTEFTPAIMSVPAFTHVTVDRDQVGSSTPGGFLSVLVRYRSA